MRRRTNTILMALIVLASVMPAMSSMRGLVVCFSSDGRVEVEMQHVAPGCLAVCGASSIADGAGDQAGLIDGQMSHGHSCSDVSLGDFDFRTDRLRPASPRTSFDLPLTPVITLAWFESSSLDGARSNAHRKVAQEASARLSKYSALRCVILRI